MEGLRGQTVCKESAAINTKTRKNRVFLVDPAKSKYLTSNIQLELQAHVPK